ncbi:MAG: HEAT repeat domain-containing protein [Chloroflexota bacterium]
MPTAQPSNFVRALRRMAAATDTPTPTDINALSGATRENLAEWRAEWPHVPPHRQHAIVQAMVEAAELSVHSDFSDVFIALLDESDEVVRARAIDGLWENETPTLARRWLRFVMEDKSALVRASAADGLGHFLLRAELGRQANPSAQTITDALLTRFNDPNEDDEVRRHALESVAYASDERVSDVIREAYDEGDETMRASAVFAMGRNADSEWNDIVVDELSSRDAAMRYEAAYAAGELMAVEALPQLIELVEDADHQVRESAVWALGQIGGREARRVLESVLAGDDEALHEAAEDALAELEFAAGEEPFSMFDFDADVNGNGHVRDDEE